MTTPVRRVRRSRPRRSFDLRATALFFGLLALLLSILGLAFRTAAATLERRPAWAVVLVVVAVVTVLAVRRRRRRFSAKRAARQATAALEEATRTALDALETPPPPTAPAPAARIDAEAPAAGGPRAPGPRADPEGTEPTVVLTDGTEPTVVLPEGTAATVAAGLAPDTVAGADVVEPLPEDVVHGELLDYGALDAEEFEHAVAGLCERDGCTGVEVVGGAGDLGADVLAVAPDGRRLVVQCKRYCDTNRVGSQDLQRFGGTCYTVHEADVAIIVTTSDFTAPAAEYAEQCGIVCVDGEALRAWSDGTGPRPWDGPAAGGPLA
ncbi:restriction endonuclease [Streptomyces sp. NPDC017936]|uniref:restriction endonuclease n=1 Tax=Streptomyces sp. NPDC017936 TaxID=3365016 RepID=UPI0037B12542